MNAPKVTELQANIWGLRAPTGACQRLAIIDFQFSQKGYHVIAGKRDRTT